VALPSLWIYQILFGLIGPVMDVAVIWALCTGNLIHVGTYYLLMLGVEVLGATLAVWLDGGGWRLLPWIVLQRFLYRQLLYYVVIRSLLTAIRGNRVGWNKLDRLGTVRIESPTAV
jgi:hypothetical protein